MSEHSPDPTPKQLRQRLREVRSHWSPKVARRRLTTKPVPYEIPRVSLPPELRHVEAEDAR